MQSLNVDLGDRSYPIYIGDNLIDKPELFRKHVAGGEKGRVLVVTNETVAPLYLQRVLDALGELQKDHLILADGEQYKTLDTLNQVFDHLLSNKFDRSCTLIALGGGVIGDITGFAAASYQRGVHFIQIPTTLLSQVDSSVGGKTGVNHALGKNMIGAFYQPRCVLADTEVLKTLPDREVKAGLAEIVKYGLINDTEFFGWLAENTSGLLELNAEILTIAIQKSCQHKADIVAADEREGGVRALLNLGHTFGHAIETASGYGVLLHGEAVAIGLVMAADLSMRLGWLSAEDAQHIRQVLENFGMPIAPPADITEQQYLDLMVSDKKARQGQIRFVLMKALGHSVLTTESDDIDSTALSETLTAGDRLCL